MTGINPKTISDMPCKIYSHSSKLLIKIPPFHTYPVSCSLFITKNHPFKISTKRSKTARFQFRCLSTNPASQYHSPLNPSVIKALILLVFSLILLFLRLISNLLLPDFSQRWHELIAFSAQAEAKLISQHYPQHLLQAVVAYEDRRFFSHFGVDPIGVARAVVSLSTRGGGSTITQQLVRNTFLKNERTLLRKVVEILLALALERRISKLRILSSYLFKIYWGHGVNGIESASLFYFGKQPSLLSLGECAMLSGIIPSPELRSPFRDASRGKRFQARVLRRMVEIGFLDVATALIVVKQSLCLNSPGLDHGDGSGIYMKWKGNANITVSEIWDWEIEDKIWEVKEDMQRWIINFLRGKEGLAMYSHSNDKAASFDNRVLVATRKEDNNVPQSYHQQGQEVHLVSS
ncbi:hypothetical protein ACH5RR_026315 [Cinchona calisaya]|uniref:Glycosyl transferase family 51 domain-containing protein n=1 Tax=Cinchona calisaya TaxID=153742 RepID=A0ABD2Z276_9GENT